MPGPALTDEHARRLALRACSGPLEFLRVWLGQARAAGREFDAVWPAALHATAHWFRGQDAEWRPAVEATRDGWCRAYDGVPATSLERAVAVLHAGMVGAPEPERPEPVGGCAWCRGPIPAGRQPSAKHCSKACRRTHAYARQRLRVGKPAPARPDPRTLPAREGQGYDVSAARVTTAA